MNSDIYKKTKCTNHECHIKQKKDHRDVTLKTRIINIISVNEKYAQTCGIYQSLASVKSEKDRHTIEKYFIIHPFSTFSFYWKVWMCIVYHIAFIFIPLEACNVYYAQLQPDLFVNYGTPMLFMHSIFILDIFVNFNIGYVEKRRRHIILNKKSIMQKYMKSSFFLDIISSGPAILNTITLYFLPGRKHYSFVTILNFLKMFKLTVLTRYSDKIACFFRHDGIRFQVFRFLTRSVFFMHWAACLIFILPFVLTQQPITVFSNNTWIHIVQSNVAKMDIFKMYLASLFHAVSMTLRCSATRPPDEFTDFVISIFFTILGIIYMCYLFIQILNMVRSVMESQTKYDEFMTQLRDYMNYNHLPPTVQERMFMLFEHRYQRTYYKENYILQTLPERTVKEINEFRCRRMMSRIEILKTLNTEEINDIINHFNLKLFLPRDIISQARLTNRYIYFISYGTVAAYTVAGNEICHMYDGSYFGELAIWKKDNKNMCNVIALEICEIYTLERDIFTKAISSDPVILERVTELAKQRMKEIRAVETAYRTNKNTLPYLFPTMSFEYF